MSSPAGSRGLQAERTMLAWERTALGLLANGALLMLRDAGRTAVPVLILAGAALALAVVAAVVGLRRRRRILDSPPGRLHLASTEVGVLGTGVTLLCLLAVGILPA